MQDISLSIEEISHNNQKDFWELLDNLKFHADIDYYERCVERHIQKKIKLLMAVFEGKPAGFCILNWQPKYAYFKKCGLPEIQDINVLPLYRRRGIGRAMVEFCENLARARGYDEMGIGVGLDSSFGSAQRLYVKMGYIPDGLGVCYDRKIVAKGEFRPIDENLSLMMIKLLI